MTQRDREKRLDVAAKLLAQATSVAGTAEADAFTSRAFALIARLGIDQNPDRASEGPTADAVLRHDFALSGDFLHQRIKLLARTATALHCAHAYWLHADTVATVAVYGAQRNLDRIQILYAPLLSRMLRQAVNSPWTPSTGLSLRDHQISWMQGFTVSIRARLREAEATAAAEADHGTNTPANQHTLDAQRAAAEKQRQLPAVRPSTYRPTLGLDSVVEGLHAGNDKPNNP
ncbi:DUF2786 domain-containing protein [Nocardia jiangxiensis]|uniref:DUF2786 domain-containing protein n=1 Tax=Nocardia jiangxiensis TaxID=282685 RepID=UPI0005948220|nr:DUF2786 domain-containing protein [Nocardia jiangxiensis]